MKVNDVELTSALMKAIVVNYFDKIEDFRHFQIFQYLHN